MIDKYGKNLTEDEIEMMKQTVSDIDTWKETLVKLKSKRGGVMPKDYHKMVVKHSIFKGVNW